MIFLLNLDSFRYYSECNLDSMVMYINKTFLPLPTPSTPFVASWNDPSCQAADDGNILTFSTGYSSCGMQLTQTDDNVIFQNTAKVIGLLVFLESINLLRWNKFSRLRGFLIFHGDLISRIGEEIEVFEKGQNIKIKFFQKLNKLFLKPNNKSRLFWNRARR